MVGLHQQIWLKYWSEAIKSNHIVVDFVLLSNIKPLNQNFDYGLEMYCIMWKTGAYQTASSKVKAHVVKYNGNMVPLRNII